MRHSAPLKTFYISEEHHITEYVSIMLDSMDRAFVVNKGKCVLVLYPSEWLSISGPDEYMQEWEDGNEIELVADDLTEFSYE